MKAITILLLFSLSLNAYAIGRSNLFQKEQPKVVEKETEHPAITQKKVTPKLTTR